MSNKKSNVTPLHPENLHQPEVKSEVRVEAKHTQVASADSFLKILNVAKEEVNDHFGKDINGDNSYVMVQYHLDEASDKAGQVFITSVRAAMDQNGDGLLVLGLMSEEQYNAILQDTEQDATVLSHAGLVSIIEEFGKEVPLDHAQLIVDTTGTRAVPLVSGEIIIEKDDFLAAVPQQVIYDNGDAPEEPSVLYIQI